MLKEEQVAELLTRCETVTGQRLEQIRGNLSSAETRSAAIWELVVLDASTKIGAVEYEPHSDGSPDIRVTLPSGNLIWIEIAFLYPRFWKEERQSFEVSQWLRREADRRGVDGFKISCRFSGPASRSGYIRKLPQLHQRNNFLKSEIVKEFFNQIVSNKTERAFFTHPEYTIEVLYAPESNGGGGGGVVQEAPKHYKEHALYRIVKEKARQHDVPGIRLLCIGTDQSNALSTTVAPGCVNASEALYHAYNQTTSISGVITVGIESRVQGFTGITRDARAIIYYNERAKVIPDAADKDVLSKLNFNLWKYHQPLNQYDTPPNGLYRKLGGRLSVSTSNNGGKLTIPTTALLEVLAGRASLSELYDLSAEPLLSGDYCIKSCSFQEGSPEAGDSSTVTLDFDFDFDAVFKRVKRQNSTDSEPGT
jgi:hypothetical protein